MAFEGIKQAYQQAVKIYHVDHSALKAIQSFVSALWKGKQVSVPEYVEQQTVGGASDYAVTPLEKRYAEVVEPEKIFVGKEGKLSKSAKSNGPKKRVGFAKTGSATSGSTDELKKNSETITIRKSSKDGSSRGVNSGEFNLSQNECDDLIGLLEEEGTEGFKEYLSSGYHGNKGDVGKFLNFRDFLLNEGLFSDKIEDVWLEAVTRELAREGLKDLRNEVLSDFEHNKELTKADLSKELKDFVASASERVKDVDSKLEQLNLKLPEEAYKKALQHASEEIDDGLKKDATMLEGFWGDIEAKRAAVVTLKSKSAYTRFSDIDEAFKRGEIDRSKGRELRKQSDDKLTALSKEWGVKRKPQATRRKR